MSAPRQRLSAWGVTEGPISPFFPVLESDRVELVKEVKGEGGPNTFLRWIQAHAKRLHVPGRAMICVTAGMIDRARAYSTFAGMDGGLQRRIPLNSMRQAGLIPPVRAPLFDGDEKST